MMRGDGSGIRGAFVLSSPDPQLAGHFPDRYVLGSFGCTGGNASPPLRWRGAPAGTKSFVLTLFDRDEHGSPSGWWHWVVYDIPAATAELPAGAGADRGDALPRGARMGRTDLGTSSRLQQNYNSRLGRIAPCWCGAVRECSRMGRGEGLGW